MQTSINSYHSWSNLTCNYQEDDSDQSTAALVMIDLFLVIT